MPLASLRGRLQGTLRPLTGTLVKWGVHPNALTVMGFAIAVGAAVAFDQHWVRTAGLLVLLSGFFDIIDGQVARISGLGSEFGAFFDATLDRVGEVVVFIGIIGFYLRGRPEPAMAMVYVTLIAMTASMMVSYTKGKAEAMGLDCDVGVAQRAERLILVGAPALFVGMAWNGWAVDAGLVVLAVLSVITTIQRVIWVQRHTRVPVEEPVEVRE